MLTRRHIIAGLGVLPFAGAVRAAEWPDGPVRIIVPFPPGGSVDAVARQLAPGLHARLGVSIVVENMPGASGSIGTAAAVRAIPDGRTLMLAFDTHAVNPSLIRDLPYNTDTDLEPVYLVGRAPNLLATSLGRPFRSLADVIEAARARPDSITYASTGTGTLGHLTMVRLSAQAGVRLVHVPYKGGGPAVTDAIGGQVDLVIGSVALLTPHVKGGKLRPIVQTGRDRIPALGDTQTTADAGFAGLESYAWWGFFAPKGTQQAVIARLTGELRAVVKEDKVSRQLAEGQQMTLLDGGPEELRAFVAQETALWRKIILENDIKPDS